MIKQFFTAVTFFILGSISIQAQAVDIETNRMVLRGVDKVTGRVRTIEAEVGQLFHFGNLTIYPERCLTRPPEEAPENSVFLTITEPDYDQVYKIIFNGWMFSSNPALSAMEHPIYDLWVISCVMDENSRPTDLKEDAEAAQAARQGEASPSSVASVLEPDQTAQQGEASPSSAASVLEPETLGGTQNDALQPLEAQPNEEMQELLPESNVSKQDQLMYPLEDYVPQMDTETPTDSDEEIEEGEPEASFQAVRIAPVALENL